MNTAKEHYENILADRYVWLMGGYESNIQKNAELFASLGLIPQKSSNAVDLGAGAGFQSIPLARAGYNVVAVDLSAALLEQLTEHAQDVKVTTVCDDMLHFAQHCPPKIELAVCMGDTLPQLSKRDEVAQLLGQLSQRLENGGDIVLMFRDLNQPHTGLDRFIPVRSDSDRIFTCFLEYGPERVTVNDLIYERQNGGWVLYKGSYPKLRLDPAWVSSLLTKAGLRIAKTQNKDGMITILAHKPE